MKQIIVVPFFVHDAVLRNNLRLEAILDFNQIRSILSTNDLAVFLALQSKLNVVVGTDDITTRSNLYEQWHRTATPDNLTYLENSVRALELTSSVNDDLNTRLFIKDSALRNRYVEPFISYDLSPKHGAIVIYPGYFSQTTDTAMQIRFVSAVLKLLHMYHEQHDVYSTVWQKQYLRLLSGKQLSV